MARNPNDKITTPRGEIQEVLERLQSLEQSLLKQRNLSLIGHEEMASKISDQVVEKLKSYMAVQTAGPLTLPSAQLTETTGGFQLNTSAILLDTDAILRGYDSNDPNKRRAFESTQVAKSGKRSAKVADERPLVVNPQVGDNEMAPSKRSTVVSVAGADGSLGGVSFAPSGAGDILDLPAGIPSAQSIGGEVDDSPTRKGSATQKLDSLNDDLQAAQETSHGTKLEKLRKAIELMEDLEEPDDTPRPTFQQRLQHAMNADMHKKDTALDLAVACVIVLNAAVIGVSMDYPWAIWQIIDVCFTCCFLIELALKFKLHGIRGHFAKLSNCADFCLVVLDIVQLFMEKIIRTDMLEGTPSASMFRIVRLTRLARLIRLARLKMFDELVAMITGLVGGMSTLIWAILFMGLIVYITALLFREFYGNRHIEYGGEDITGYFQTVPRAMLTVFRYFFGDFTTLEGISLLECIQKYYGTINGLFVSLLFFMITIGLFNVIAAIFVESTLAAAFALTNARKTERMNDRVLWGSRIRILARKFFEYSGCEIDHENPLSEQLEDFCEQQCTADMFAKFIQDRAVVKALTDLEIDEADHKYLFDILDNDNTGDILVSQLSDGVERLRGDPRRSDIICVDLMVRSIQEQANFLCKAQTASLENLGSIKKMLKRIEGAGITKSIPAGEITSGLSAATVASSASSFQMPMLGGNTVV